MDIRDAARCMEKLGNPTRLEVFHLLVRAGEDGLAVGDIQRHLGIPASTLSHHLAHLVAADLVQQVREGRVLRCRPNFARMNAVLAFLTEECCVGVGATADQGDGPTRGKGAVEEQVAGKRV
ncbi:MAG: ArsR family transcriptional regulator [Alphaproteobacteria bacterium]|nr:MAG: ArsR family transcriptional regulator [Alphaproteobacteria bacterium]